MKRQRREVREENEEDVFYTFSELLPEMHDVVCSFLSKTERAALALTCRRELKNYPHDKTRLVLDCISQLQQHHNIVGIMDMLAYIHHPILVRWVEESQSIKWSLDTAPGDTDNDTEFKTLSTFFDANCRIHYPPMSFNTNYYLCFGRTKESLALYSQDRSLTRQLLDHRRLSVIRQNDA